VSFGGVAAKCVVSSASTIVTAVPPLAGTGVVAVTSGGSTVSLVSPFSVTIGILLPTKSGTPTTSTAVSGSGFAANEAVDIYLASTDQVLVVTNSAGAFSYPGLVIPASAQPGPVWVSAVGRRSGLAAQAPFTVRTNWVQLGFGAQGRRFNPYENTLSEGNVASIGLDWSYAAPGGAHDHASPAVVNGVVYIGSGDGSVYALNATTGAPRWSYATGSSVVSSPAVANGVVYIGSNDGKLYALSASYGSLMWSSFTGAPVSSSPAVANGSVFVGANDGTIHMFGLGLQSAAPARPNPAALRSAVGP